jgi:hypothetical protein
MKRPFRITLIVLGVLSLAVFNAWRAILAARQFEYLRGLSLEGPALALSLTGLVWAAGFGVAAIGLYRLRRWARLWTMAAIAFYTANLWLIRLIFEKSPDEPLTRPADAALAVLSIAVVWGVLSWPSLRRMFT